MDDLSLWQLHDVYSLDEAACLIVGIHPKKPYLDDHEDAATRSARGALEKAIRDPSPKGLYAEVCDSMPFMRTIDEPWLVANYSSEDLTPKVLKSDLIQWLDTRSYYPPFFFPEKSGEPTPKEPKEAPPKKEPTYTTPLMEALNDAALYFWEGVAPKDRHAPTNANVVDWILEELEKRGLKKSKNIAEAMATIIRHPDKP